MNVSWKHPFTCIVSAPTKSGKTEFVKKLILNNSLLIDVPPAIIHWSFMEWQPTYDDLKQNSEIGKSIQFVEGLPDLNELKANQKIPQLLVLDDMMQEMGKDKRLVELFTRGCHHWNVSVIHIVQNAFFSGLRTSRINAQYLVLMKNPADRLQVQTLGRQLFTGSKHFIEAYNDATEKPFGYLLVDLSQTTPDNLRLRTNIFPDDEYQFVYVAKV
jgi:hypothetical protein